MIYGKLFTIILQKLAEFVASKILGLVLNLSKTGAADMPK